MNRLQGGMHHNASTSVPMLPSLSTSSIGSTFSGLAARRKSVCPPKFITGNGSGSGGAAGAAGGLLQQIGSGVVSGSLKIGLLKAFANTYISIFF